MKVVKFISKILLFILTIILSIVLITDNIVFNVREITSQFISEEQIKKSINSINILDLLKDENGNDIQEITYIKQELVNTGLPVEVVEEFIESEPVKNFTSEIVSASVDYIFYNKQPEIINSFNADTLYNFVETNMSVIAKELQEKNVPKSELLTEENQQKVLTNMKEVMPVIEENIRKVTTTLEEQIKGTNEYQDMLEYQRKVEEALNIIRYIYSDTVTTILIVIGVFCIIGIILCSLSFYKYLKTLGIVSLICGTILYVAGIFVDKLNIYVIEIPYIFQDLYNLIVNDSKQMFINSSIPYFIIGVVLIIINIVIYFILDKREDKKIEL